MGLKRYRIAPPPPPLSQEPYFFLKIEPFGLIFTLFLKNKLISREHKPFIVAQNRIILDFLFFDAKTQIEAKQK